MQIIKRMLCPKKSIAIASVILSVITSVGLVRTVILPQQNRMENLTDLVVGGTTVRGYYKTGDMLIVPVIAVSFILFSLLYLTIINAYDRRRGEGADYFGVLVGAWWFYIVLTYAVGAPVSRREIIAWVVAAVVAWIFNTTKDSHGWNYSSSIFITFLMSELSLLIICYAINSQFNIGNRFFRKYIGPIQIFSLLIFLVFIVYIKRYARKVDYKKVILLSQLLLPLVFLCIYKYRYIYRGEVIEEYFSNRLMYFCIAVTIGCMIYNIFALFDKVKIRARILPTTLVSAAAFFNFILPSGNIKEDFYHYGELSVPFQQLFHYGQIPFWEYTPVHGMCDFYYSAVSKLFFDTTFSSIVPAEVIGNVILTVFVAIVLYYCLDNEAVAFLITVFFAGNIAAYRTVFLICFMAVMLGGKIGKNFYGRLWWWCVLSIVSVLWYPTLGGVTAVSFLPVLVYEFLRDRKQIVMTFKAPESRKKIVMSFIPVVIIGLLLLPIFAGIFVDVYEHSLESAVSTGNEVFEGASLAIKDGSAVAKLVFIVISWSYIGLLVISVVKYLLCDKEEKRKVMDIIVFLLPFCILVSNYTMARYDGGGRGFYVSIIVMATIGPILLLQISGKKKTMTGLSLLLAIFSLFRFLYGVPVFDSQNKIVAKGVIDDSYQYVRGEDIGAANLGNVYVNEDYYNLLSDTGYVVERFCQGDETFLDISNLNAFYNIMDKKNIALYSSMLITANDVMQKKVIESLSEQQPAVVLVLPAAWYDEVNSAYKNILIFNWLVENDYYPYYYGDRVFLLRKDLKFDQDGLPALAGNLHMQQLGYLPIQWGNKDIENKFLEDENIGYRICDYDDIELEGDHFIVKGESPYITFQFDEAVDGKKADFLRIQNLFSDRKKHDIRLYFWNLEEDISEQKQYEFVARDGEEAVPMVSSPYWSYSKNIDRIRIYFEDIEVGHSVKIQIGLESIK